MIASNRAGACAASDQTKASKPVSVTTTAAYGRSRSRQRTCGTNSSKPAQSLAENSAGHGPWCEWNSMSDARRSCARLITAARVASLSSKWKRRARREPLRRYRKPFDVLEGAPPRGLGWAGEHERRLLCAILHRQGGASRASHGPHAEGEEALSSCALSKPLRETFHPRQEAVTAGGVRLHRGAPSGHQPSSKTGPPTSRRTAAAWTRVPHSSRGAAR